MKDTTSHSVRLLTSAAAVLAISAASAAEIGEGGPAHDKSQYHLFNATPRVHLREMSTDRPDKTESAYTVDAGHFQIEMDLASYTYDRHTTDNTTVRSLSIAPINLKVGLCNNADLQFVIDSYTHVRTRDRGTGTTTRNRGFGDITTRLKVNFWGNDGGTTAFAAMPFVKLPTNQDGLGNDSVEAGLILPLAVELPHGWGLGVMTEVDFNADDDGSGHHPEFINTITFSHDIIGNLGGYVEFFSLVSSESGSEWQGTVDLGLTYALTADIQLDAGINME